MASNNVLRATLDHVASAAGFVKKSGSWYLRQRDTIAVVNIQKSQYGDQYYINIALWLLPLGEVLYPREHKCHIRSRIDELIPERSEELSKILNLGCEYPHRSNILGDIIGLELVPMLQSCSTIDDLRVGHGRMVVGRSLVTGEAQQILQEP